MRKYEHFSHRGEKPSNGNFRGEGVTPTCLFN